MACITRALVRQRGREVKGLSHGLPDQRVAHGKRLPAAEGRRPAEGRTGGLGVASNVADRRGCLDAEDIVSGMSRVDESRREVLHATRLTYCHANTLLQAC